MDNIKYLRLVDIKTLYFLQLGLILNHDEYKPTLKGMFILFLTYTKRIHIFKRFKQSSIIRKYQEYVFMDYYTRINLVKTGLIIK